MIKAVIFDMDGLMIDSERVTYNGYVKVMKEMNLSITEDFYKTFPSLTPNISIIGCTLCGV